MGSKKPKPPTVPTCPTCQQPMLRCECKDNVLKK